MKIDRLLGYLQGRSESTPEKATAAEARSESTPHPTEAEAVKVSSDFGRGEAGALAREARVQKIKGEVEAGTYVQPDSDALARVLARDLF